MVPDATFDIATTAHLLYRAHMNDSLRKLVERHSERDWPWWRVREALALKGYSLAEVARRIGIKPPCVYATAKEPRMRIQAHIGQLLGIDPRQIWPSRYAADGRPMTFKEMVQK